MKFIIIFCLFAFPLFAEDFTFNKDSGKAQPNYIAQLKVARGKVFKSTHGRQEEVKVGTRFYKDDILITETSSFAQLLIVDDTVLTLGARSELKFSDFKFTDKTDRHIVFSFIKGQIRGQVKNKAKEGDIVFKTKLAVMGIRGTEILINHRTIKDIEVSEFALLSGSAQVKDDKNQNNELVKTDRIVIVQDSISKESLSERLQLSEADLNALTKKDHFMDFFELANLDKSSALHSFSDQGSSATQHKADSGHDSSEQTGDKKGLHETLKKLNEKLKEYQNKTR